MSGYLRSVRDDIPAAGFCAKNLIRRHPEFTLGPISITVNPGEVVALVGANGSGKTTTLNLLAELDQPEEGTVSFPCPNPAAALRCGLVTDADDMPEDLTAREMWSVIARVSSACRSEATTLLDRARSLAATFVFTQHDQLIGTLSHGNRQKAKLVAAFMVEPPTMLLDEPRNGLDPVAIHHLNRQLTGYAGRGGALVFATHDLHYAERSASRIVALHQGRVVFNGTAPEVPGRSLPDWYVQMATSDV